MKQIGHFLTFLASLLVRVLAAVLAGVLLLTLVYCIPTEPIEQNLALSAEVFAAEGVMPELFPWCTSILDNQTDAVMLSHAAHTTAESPIVQAMTANRHHIDGLDSPAALVAHYLGGQPFDTQIPYYQYWHGYLVFLKPLLYFTTYQGIRLINTFAQAVLLILLCGLMLRKGLKRCLVPFLISLAFLMPVTLAMSLQFSTCYYILTLGSIAILLAKDHLDQKDAFIFLYIGIATAFFDFLTYPIATLGIPAVFYFSILTCKNIQESFSRGVKICFSWGFGYGIMWAGKWLVGSLITGINILTTASSKIAERTSVNTTSQGSLVEDLYTALSINIRSFLHSPVVLILALYVLTVLFLLFLSWKKKRFTVSEAATALFPFLVLAFLPPIWYMVTANHSTIHHWFTYKALIVSAFAGMCALTHLRNTTN